MTPDLQALLARLTIALAPSTPDRMNYGFPIQLTQAEARVLVDALFELAKAKAENARLYDAIGDERESCVDVVQKYRKRAKHSGYWAGYHEDVIAAIRARPLPSPPKDPAHD